LGALKAILEGKVEGQGQLSQLSPDEIHLEDQGDDQGHLDSHAEEPEFTDARKAQFSRNAAKEPAQTYSGFTCNISNIKYVSSGPNSQAHTPKQKQSEACTVPHQRQQVRPLKGALEHDTLSQSLESFVKHNTVKDEFAANLGASRHTEAATDQDLALNLSDYAQRR